MSSQEQLDQPDQLDQEQPDELQLVPSSTDAQIQAAWLEWVASRPWQPLLVHRNAD